MHRFCAALVVAIAASAGLVALVQPIEAGGGGGRGCPQAPREGTNEPVTIRDSCFTPAVLYVEAGATVTWTNNDDIPHNAAFLDGSKLLELADAKQSLTPRTFSQPGLYPYYCTLHPWMLGVVAVGDRASFAKSAPPSDASPPPAVQPKAAADSRGWMPAAGAVLAVGLVSASGGYLLHRLRR